MDYQSYLETFLELKEQGVPKDEALDCLEFDSDQYPDMDELKAALNEAYKVVVQ